MDLSILLGYTNGSLLRESAMVGAKKSTDKEIGKVLLEGYRCRCGHEWLKRGESEPRVCPKCKSPRWDRPFVQPKEAEE